MWLVVVAALMVGADVVAAVVVPQAGWERVGLVVVVGVGRWTLEEAGRRELVVEVQSGPAFCACQFLVLSRSVGCCHDEGVQEELDGRCGLG